MATFSRCASMMASSRQRMGTTTTQAAAATPLFRRRYTDPSTIAKNNSLRRILPVGCAVTGIIVDPPPGHASPLFWETLVACSLAFGASTSLLFMLPSSTRKGRSDCAFPQPDSCPRSEDDLLRVEKPLATMATFASLFEHRSQEEYGSSSTTTLIRTKRKKKEEPYDISVRAIKGGRVTMEDEFFVAEGGRFVAVFDGHGGGGVSQFLKRHLYEAVCHHLKTMGCSGGSTTADKRSVFSHVAALKAAFAQMDRAVLEDDTLGYQGSTAVAVLLHESDQGHRTLLSANVGDSRAILSRAGHAVDLTRDHKPNEEQEKARILAMGETIEWDRFAKVHRVRNLSLSRAVGDRYAKPVVSGEVEIKHYPVLDGDEFILLASDGLWDVMSSEDAVRYVHQRMEAELSRENIAKDDMENYKLVLRKNMAKFVAREAIRRGSADNVCVVMVWLKDMDSGKQ